MPPRTRPTDYEDQDQSSLGRMASFTVEVRNIYDKLDDIGKSVDGMRLTLITKVEFDYLKMRVTELEGTQKWIFRLIISAVILAGLGLVLKTQGSI